MPRRAPRLLVHLWSLRLGWGLDPLVGPLVVLQTTGLTQVVQTVLPES